MTDTHQVLPVSAQLNQGLILMAPLLTSFPLSFPPQLLFLIVLFFYFQDKHWEEEEEESQAEGQ